MLWVRWGGFNKFWSQVTRWALRTGTRSDTVATVSRSDNVGEVLVDAIDPKGEFINFLDSQVGVVSPDKTRTVVDLEQIGPGRYRGRFKRAGGRIPGRARGGGPIRWWAPSSRVRRALRAGVPATWAWTSFLRGSEPPGAAC